MNTLKNRPITPHLTVYSSQFTSIYSIWHRMTGLSLISLFVIIIFYLKSIALNLYVSTLFEFKLNLWLKNALYLNFLVLFGYHASNGIRHIFWDLGYNLIIAKVLKSVIFFTFIFILFFFIVFLKIIT